MWLEPRDLDGNSTRIDRLNRWGDRLRECQKPGCVTATLSLSETEAPQVRVERESAASAVTYEVLIEAIDDAGKSLPLPRFLVGFPAGATHAMLPSSDAQRYAGAAGFRVIDVTPFAPECNAPQPDLGCVWTVN